MDLKEIGKNTRNWVDSTQDWDYWRDIVNTELNLQVPIAMQLVSYLRPCWKSGEAKKIGWLITFKYITLSPILSFSNFTPCFLLEIPSIWLSKYLNQSFYPRFLLHHPSPLASKLECPYSIKWKIETMNFLIVNIPRYVLWSECTPWGKIHT